MGEFWNIAIWQYGFYAPNYLWLLLIVPLYFNLKLLVINKKIGLRYARPIAELKRWNEKRPKRYQLIIIGLQSLALGLFVLVFARPYHSDYNPPQIDFKKGIDIMLAIDASASMLAQDFQPNRLEVAKKVAQRFVSNRMGDRIGLIVYEGEAYTACPPTVDYSLLQQQIQRIEPGQLEQGTAVGEGLGVAVSRLRGDSLRSKVILLLTDGSNNSGTIEPLVAAELARAKKCKVYTIGVGTRGLAPTPVMTPMGVMYENLPVEIDEKTLSEIAERTGGAYFRATDENSLKEIYKEIDRMEKQAFKQENLAKVQPITIAPFFLWGFILLAFALFLKFIYFPIYEY